MVPDDSTQSSADDVARARERVVGAVLSRIASAPMANARPPGILDGIASWTVPVLAAAALIMVASTYALVQAARFGRGPERVTDALGLTPRMARFVATGDVDTWNWFTETARRP